MSAVQRSLNVQAKALREACEIFNIPRPHAGYWTLKAMGRPVDVTPLPPTSISGEICFEAGKVVIPPLPNCYAIGESEGPSDKHLSELRRLAAAVLRAQRKEEKCGADSVWALKLEYARLKYRADRDKSHRSRIFAQQKKLEVDAIINERREKKLEREDLALLQMLSSGANIAQAAQQLGVSKTTARARERRLANHMRKKLLLSMTAISALLAPRLAGKRDWRQDSWFSPGATSIESVSDLAEWYDIVAEVELAQIEMELEPPLRRCVRKAGICKTQ